MKALMVLGTGSGAGKSLITAGLLRILSDMGFDAAPFKAQNMALNSYITRDGGEIGRAQALQAEAARVEATTDMNPILLKATGPAGSQVITCGRVHGNMTASQYYDWRDEAWRIVTAAYERLAGEHGIIIMEGAGSPAEINLMDKDIVNMRMARHAGAKAVLVGDIDRGGVFASLYGTIHLQGLLPENHGIIQGFIINKFRGDEDILAPGLKMLEEMTGVTTLGVLPYLKLSLSEEDSLCLDYGANRRFHGPGLKIVIVRNPFISNFTDFEPLAVEPDVEVVYSARAREIEGADLVVIPGSKNTSRDLLFLRESGLEESVKRAAGKGTPLIGICGGFQMLGGVIKDPRGVESEFPEIRGFGLLDIETILEEPKITSQIEAIETDQIEAVETGAGEGDAAGEREKLSGYEIHAGRTTGRLGLFNLKRLATGQMVSDGSKKGDVWGTYIHGIFENDAFRGRLLNTLRARAGLPERKPVNYAALKEDGIDRLAAAIRENIDLKEIERLLCIG